MGFGDNDHAIRGLMRFIKMTSRKFTIDDVIRNGGAPNYKMMMASNSKEVQIHLYFEFEYRNTVL